MIGPTYRFNDYISLYGNVGMAEMKIKNRDNHSSSENAFAYGAGVIFNPLTNLSLGLSWETAKLLFVDTKYIWCERRLSFLIPKNASVYGKEYIISKK
ncbi:hypothetical protein LNQ03_10910 [Klebsiella pneumoniae subsp. pneumoniae]|nr:hypothetical protein [Klebsiella pneumoniae subsp. pneumoniae]